MTLSIEQREYEKLRFRKWFWIWERDLLWLAVKFEAWRALAHELGFKDKKIDTPWPHADAGRLIRYMENPYFAARAIQD
jgi:hypothetical protein